MNQGQVEGNKFALLIGVAECASGFKPLHCPPNGVIALSEILVNPKIGGFPAEQVQVLTNPNVSEMQSAIGELFSRCSHRDLVLLYFTGHGVTDEQGDFFFTTCETRKFDSGSLNRGTVVSAAFVRDEMRKCASRRQVAILDCCFSGAFPDGVLAMDDQTIDVERHLGGEGRAVLTAATSTQYALEQTGEELSVYTRYLVEGLKTGAAVPDGEELIRVGHLHHYVRDKLKTAAAAMSPQIYAAREGQSIVLARAVINNELRFRKLVQQQLRSDGTFSPVGQRILNRQARDWGISSERASIIAQEVAQPFRERYANLKEFEETYQEAVQFEYPFSEATARELKVYQYILKLQDEDVESIIQQHTPAPPPDPVGAGLADNLSPATQEPRQNPPLPQPPTPTDDIPLESEKGIDYSELRNLLKAGKWKEADQETYLRMLEVVGRKGGDWIRAEELLNFPCKDLKTIDRLWVHYSKGHFGFSVQKKIYVECGGKLDSQYPGDKIWYKFCDRVGWRKDNRYVNYSDLKFNPN